MHDANQLLPNSFETCDIFRIFITVKVTLKLASKISRYNSSPEQNRNVVIPFFLKKSPSLKNAHKLQRKIRHIFVAQIFR